MVNAYCICIAKIRSHGIASVRCHYDFDFKYLQTGGKHRSSFAGDEEYGRKMKNRWKEMRGGDNVRRGWL